MTGDIEAWMHVMQFFEALISSIADHLQEQGIDPDE
jgi:predicted lipase